MAAPLDQAWSAAWSDFLSNRVAVAERRAAPFLHVLPAKLARAAAEAGDSGPSSADAEELVTLADLAHIAGAVRGDTQLLRQAVEAYDEHLRRMPHNLQAMRMRAETLLRMRDYSEAFASFDSLYRASLSAEALEAAREVDAVAPFQLVHDAECIEDAVRQGADPAFLTTAAGWRALAESLLLSTSGDATHRTPVRQLSESQQALLASHGRPLPLPQSQHAVSWSAAEGEVQAMRALRADINWAEAVQTYATRRILVVDDLLDERALAEMQAYARHGAHFRTLRQGYLGAFPADGTTHPLVLRLAEELATAAPQIFGDHALALWWIFKYDETNPSGIGIHADPACVNLNLWLTDDAACLEGGGLTVYSHVPPLEQETIQVNHVFDTPDAEEALRAQLRAAGEVTTVPYRCNRATVFVSDQYHESLAFRFAPGYQQRRANLTLLFGDRWSASAATPLPQGTPESTKLHDTRACNEQMGMQASGKLELADTSNGWDVFD